MSRSGSMVPDLEQQQPAKEKNTQSKQNPTRGRTNPTRGERNHHFSKLPKGSIEGGGKP